MCAHIPAYICVCILNAMGGKACVSRVLISTEVGFIEKGAALYVKAQGLYVEWQASTPMIWNAASSPHILERQETGEDAERAWEWCKGQEADWKDEAGVKVLRWRRDASTVCRCVRGLEQRSKGVANRAQLCVPRAHLQNLWRVTEESEGKELRWREDWRACLEPKKRKLFGI